MKVIVNKIIKLKIENATYQLNAGTIAPQNVIDFWKKSGQFDGLLKSKAISEENFNSFKKEKKEEIKKEEQGTLTDEPVR